MSGKRKKRKRGAPAPLPPRSQRPLGHQGLRRASERLYSRYGSFRVRGIWGSFAFDVVFRTFVGVTIGLVFGLWLGEGSRPAMSDRDFLLVQFVPALHVVGVYIWQIKDDVMRERKYITRIGVICGTFYGLVLPQLAVALF